jgi:hypothetical protein
MAEVLPWLQQAIHQHDPESKYDVERHGAEFVPAFVELE